MAIMICMFWELPSPGKITLMIYSEPIKATPAREAAFEIRMIQFTENAMEG